MLGVRYCLCVRTMECAGRIVSCTPCVSGGAVMGSTLTEAGYKQGQYYHGADKHGEVVVQGRFKHGLLLKVPPKMIVSLISVLTRVLPRQLHFAIPLGCPVVANRVIVRTRRLHYSRKKERDGCHVVLKFLAGLLRISENNYPEQGLLSMTSESGSADCGGGLAGAAGACGT